MKKFIILSLTFLTAAFIVSAAPELLHINTGAINDGLTAVYAFSPLIPIGMKRVNISDLKHQAANLSNFAGTASGKKIYTGRGDALLDFAGDIDSFAGEFVEHLEKQFVVSIVNANAATRIPVLFAGYFKANSTLAPGQLVQGAFNDKNGAAGLTGNTESEKSIEELLLFLNECPTRLLAIKIKSTLADQVSQKLVYQRLSPFRTEPTKIIRPDNFQNQDTYQDKQVTFPVNVQIDNQARLELPIVGASTCYITFYFGTSINMSLALERKADVAHGNIAAIGKDVVIGAAVQEKALLGT